MPVKKGLLNNLIATILPKKRSKPGGVSVTNTFEESGVVTIPRYREHLQNISEVRSISNSRELIGRMMKQDPDASAATYAYLTVANTPFVYFTKDAEGRLDPEGQKIVNAIVHNITRRWDYSQGFQLKRPLSGIAEELRYQILETGAIASELVLDKQLNADDIRIIDVGTVEWLENTPGVYKPTQTTGQGDPITLDYPTVFVNFHKRDPKSVYTYSPFVSCINTAVARMQVINDLYSIMQQVGFPRIELTVLEEVLMKNAPANIKTDTTALKSWVRARLSEEANRFSTVGPDQTYVHTDSIQSKVLNDRGGAVSLDISSVIDTLNAQNQAGLKTMATIIGRGESGVNTASVEARLFSLHAESLNQPVAAQLSEILTLAYRLTGNDGYVEGFFKPVEMRPDLELEPQKNMKQARLLEELSLGLITDEEYHFEMHGKLPTEGVVSLSGTNFKSKKIDTNDISSNSDPLGRSVSPEGSESAKSNTME